MRSKREMTRKAGESGTISSRSRSFRRVRSEMRPASLRHSSRLALSENVFLKLSILV